MSKKNEEVYINATGFQCLEHLQNNSVDLYLSTCGVQNCPPGHWYGPGSRDEYIIHFICEGKGIYKVGEKTYYLKKGDLFLICPNTTIYYEADKNDPWDYIWVGFQGIKSTTYLEYAGLSKNSLIGHFYNTSFILACVQQMMLSRTLTYFNELKRQSALLQVFSALIEERYYSLSEEEQSEYPHRVYLEQALDYISKNLKNNIRISDIANHIGIDRSYLTTIFKSTLNLSPQEYLITYKIDRAVALLENPDIKISNIGLELGYSDPLTFSKMFKRYKGVSPSEYRASLK